MPSSATVSVCPSPRGRRHRSTRCRPTSKVFGAIYSAESCSYDPVRNLIVVPNRGVGQNVQTNNGWVSFINHDGSVHTARWIGMQTPGDQRANMTPPLVLNEPSGSDIANGMLYVSDRDGGTTPTDPLVAVIRRFNMQTGAPAGEIRVDTSTGFNDIEVADDGTIYATQTGSRRPESRSDDAGRFGRSRPTAPRPSSIQGAPLRQPNGIAFDAQGNIVVVNIGNNEVLTFSPDGQAAQDRERRSARQRRAGGHARRHEVRQQRRQNGGVSRIRPGPAAELIAQNIPNPASMCYDAGANQLVIPMNANNALAFVPLK